MDFQTICWLIVAVAAPVGMLLNAIDMLVDDDE